MLIEKLQAATDFTSTEKNIAEYILANSDKVCGMTVRALAAEIFVAPSTITRMCRKMGFENYSDFKVRLSAECTELYRKIGTVDTNYPFEKQDHPREIVDKLAKLSIRHILAIQENIDYYTMSRIVNAMRHRRNIDVYGLGLSLSNTYGFAEKMAHIGYSVNVRPGNTEQLYQAMTSGPDRFAIFISHSGRTKIQRYLIQKLHERKVPTLLITANELAPMKQYADFVLPLSSSEELALEDKLDTFGAQMSVHFLLDCLFALLFADNYERNMELSHQLSRTQFESF